MSPRYERNDEIALIRSSFETIEWGTPYVLDTKEGLKFKIVYDNGEFFRLSSYDSVKYPEFNYPKKDVVAVYKYVGMIRV
jgi:phage repressor protein C with HTH and peptisase S24 domain